MPDIPFDPANVLSTDPGDETQRNFRYQHGYGALLLILGYTAHYPCKAIWCEHHEDLFAEMESGDYEAYQVKTRRPEKGDWTLSDTEIQKCLGRFVELHRKFGQRICRFVIVSNAEFMTCGLDIQDEGRIKKSIVRFLEAVKSTAADQIGSPWRFADVLHKLSTQLNCTPDELFSVLSRTDLVKGPPKDNFETEISHNALTECNGCNLLDKTTLNNIRDEIFQRVFEASSLSIDDPAKWTESLLSPSQSKLKAKRVSTSVVEECINQSGELIFRYQPVDGSLSISSNVSNKNILKEKLAKGNLDDLVRSMNRRALSTERRLLEKSYLPKFDLSSFMTQIESVVQAECDDAAVESLQELGTKDNPRFGPLMYKKVSMRLKDIVENSPQLVMNEPYEALIGIVGLLSENCSVWWSDKFQIRGAA